MSYDIQREESYVNDGGGSVVRVENMESRRMPEKGERKSPLEGGMVIGQALSWRGTKPMSNQFALDSTLLCDPGSVAVSNPRPPATGRVDRNSRSCWREQVTGIIWSRAMHSPVHISFEMCEVWYGQVAQQSWHAP